MNSSKRLVPLMLMVPLFYCASAADKTLQKPVALHKSTSSQMIKPAQNPVVEVVRAVREAVVKI